MTGVPLDRPGKRADQQRQHHPLIKGGAAVLGNAVVPHNGQYQYDEECEIHGSTINTIYVPKHISVMLISMIAAMGKNRVIGRDNDLPWHLPEDFAFFKAKTRNHVVIMGRKNWESLPEKFRPLPDRTNLVITRQAGFTAKGAHVMPTLEAALAYARRAGEREAFIIGGGEIYRMALPLADRIYLTEIHDPFDGDVTFPVLDNSWKEASRKHHPKDERHAHAFDFVVYDRK
jgi:dihydrofolate reductase